MVSFNGYSLLVSGRRSDYEETSFLTTKSHLLFCCPREDKSLGGLYVLVVLLKMEFFLTKLKEKVIDVVSDEEWAVVTSSLKPSKMSLCSK